jgi:putative oxygen-independent coproporphyrinogen III oxidase
MERYVQHVLADLDVAVQHPAASRQLISIFIGGGTPSLLSGAAVQTLLTGIRARLELAADVEITLEANPGAADARRFAEYRAAGVNRLSIGVQSLAAAQLRRLGRIHDPAQARAAVAAARSAGFDNLNLDLMFALPEQSLAEAGADVAAVLALEPEHVSYYQLTLEPDTAFAAQPPVLPDEDLTAEMALQGRELLARAGLAQYEVSAFARPQRQCRHNRNYWQFGDYLGIGAGAHGKLTEATADGWRIWRTAQQPLPEVYLAAAPAALTVSRSVLSAAECRCEFALNALRLAAGFDAALFTHTTGLPFAQLAEPLAQAVADGLLEWQGERIVATVRGWDFLDEVVARFA